MRLRDRAGDARHRVSVAAQRLDNNSLLNWTERAIRMRKECPEFGWGELRFLETDNPAVLAHTCSWRGNTVAAVHNLSRATVSARVEWPAGTQQVLHVFGRTIGTPTPGEQPDIVDLDGYDYRWMRLH